MSIQLTFLLFPDAKDFNNALPLLTNGSKTVLFDLSTNTGTTSSSFSNSFATSSLTSGSAFSNIYFISLIFCSVSSSLTG